MHVLSLGFSRQGADNACWRQVRGVVQEGMNCGWKPCLKSAFGNVLHFSSATVTAVLCVSIDDLFFRKPWNMCRLHCLPAGEHFYGPTWPGLAWIRQPASLPAGLIKLCQSAWGWNALLGSNQNNSWPSRAVAISGESVSWSRSWAPMRQQHGQIPAAIGDGYWYYIDANLS